MDSELRPASADGGSSVVRVAAVGDPHISLDSRGKLRPGLASLKDNADFLLIAGDLTQHGHRDEGCVLAEELADAGVPIFAVHGNHDYHHGEQDAIRKELEGVGVRMLEGESVMLKLGTVTVGVAGAKGFGGGFTGACGTEFGEPEMKDFMRHTKALAGQLRDALATVRDCDLRIALTHYSPIKATLVGERLEIYPFLGTYLLAEVIDAASCQLAVHGHAHRGSEHGITPGGVPVRNVARPVIKHAYKVYSLRPGT